MKAARTSWGRLVAAGIPMLALAHTLALVLVFGTGCISKASVLPDSYSIDAPAADAGGTKAGSVVVSLSNATVAPVYAGRGFVYRVGPHRVEKDPYAIFAAAPAQMLTAAIRGYLRDADFVRDVVAPGDGLPAIATIDVSATELCADLGDASASAILTLQFRVVAPGAASPPAIRNILVRTYTQRVPMGQRSAAAAVDGWNTALAAIMKAFLADLQSVLEPGS